MFYQDKKWLEIEEKIAEWIGIFIMSEEISSLNEEEEIYSSYIISSFAEYMYFYLGKSPKTWDVEDLKYVCLSLLPRHFCARMDIFEAIGPVLSSFFSFLENEEDGPSSSKRLKNAMKRLEKKMIAKAEDSSSWGLTKQIYFEDIDDEYEDDEDEDMEFLDSLFDYDPLGYPSSNDLLDFLIQLTEAYKEGLEAEDEEAGERAAEKMMKIISDNYSPLPHSNVYPIFDEGEYNEDEEEIEVEEIDREAQRTIVKGDRVGRNDPCPCGSGKKYKKCCLSK